MRVAEVFGPTIQGEGPSTGRPAAFIRLWGCNLDCAWCDTPYTWDTTGKNGVAYDRDAESTVRTVESLVAEVAAMRTPLVVVTGGEPLIQHAELSTLIDALVGRGFDVEVETNGTREPIRSGHADAVRWNVSPKLGHASTTRRSILPTLEAFEGTHAIYKFVVTEPTDLDEVDTVLAEFPHIDPTQVWIMPEGKTRPAVLNRLHDIADEVATRRWNLSPRLHVLCWGDKRGV